MWIHTSYFGILLTYLGVILAENVENSNSHDAQFKRFMANFKNSRHNQLKTTNKRSDVTSAVHNQKTDPKMAKFLTSYFDKLRHTR